MCVRVYIYAYIYIFTYIYLAWSVGGSLKSEARFDGRLNLSVSLESWSDRASGSRRE